MCIGTVIQRFRTDFTNNIRRGDPCAVRLVRIRLPVTLAHD